MTIRTQCIICLFYNNSSGNLARSQRLHKDIYVDLYFSDYFVNLSEKYLYRSENCVNSSDNESTNRWQLQALTRSKNKI